MWIGPVFQKVFRKRIDAAEKQKSSALGADEVAIYAEEQKNHRINAVAATNSFAFHMLVVISNTCGLILWHFFNWGQKQVKLANRHVDAKAKSGSGYLGPTVGIPC